jgi:hypothetical protein
MRLLWWVGMAGAAVLWMVAGVGVAVLFLAGQRTWEAGVDAPGTALILAVALVLLTVAAGAVWFVGARRGARAVLRRHWTRRSDAAPATRTTNQRSARNARVENFLVGVLTVAVALGFTGVLFIADHSNHRQALGDLPLAGTRPVDASTIGTSCYVGPAAASCASFVNRKLEYSLDTRTGPSLDTVFHITAQHDTRYLDGTLSLTAASSCGPTIDTDVIIFADTRRILHVTLTRTRPEYTLEYVNVAEPQEIRLTASLRGHTDDCRTTLVFHRPYLNSLNPRLRFLRVDVSER